MIDRQLIALVGADRDGWRLAASHVVQTCRCKASQACGDGEVSQHGFGGDDSRFSGHADPLHGLCCDLRWVPTGKASLFQLRHVFLNPRIGSALGQRDEFGGVDERRHPLGRAERRTDSLSLAERCKAQEDDKAGWENREIQQKDGGYRESGGA